MTTYAKCATFIINACKTKTKKQKQCQVISKKKVPADNKSIRAE